MSAPLLLYNSLTRQKEEFVPLNPPFVGLYVCGPTVYSDVHLGNCRTFVSFDLVYRYLLHLGYKVRYVRNITDAGHLEGDRDEGDDKFSKKARLEKLEPMEIVQKYTLGFHEMMRLFNALPPSIEPTATGHITEQIGMIRKIIDNGYAYEAGGSVYFDVAKYSQEHNYTILTNRNIDDLLANTRELGGQEEKRSRLDFALWIKAKPEHIMRWPSPWGWGFPGWHIECSAMSSKYLGERFDIHGGGMDLAATHHTNEIAQSQACSHAQPVNFWMHTNMLTVNGARMSKSSGNGFLPGQLFSGDHPLLSRGYSPMTVRFFMLQAHYRSTLDFSNEALDASDKGFKRLMTGLANLDGLAAGIANDVDVTGLKARCEAAMNDDFNSPMLIAELFEGVRIINSIKDGKMQIDPVSLDALRALMHAFVGNVLGLRDDVAVASDTASLMELIISLRQEAKDRKDFSVSDKIRQALGEAGIQLNDGKAGTSWTKA